MYDELLLKYRKYFDACLEVDTELKEARKQLAELRAQLRKKCEK